MEYYKIYKMVIKEIGKIKSKQDRFDNLYILTCMLIYNLSNEGKNIDTLLKTFKEFDYNKNFGIEREETKK